ncbi:MAG: BMP family ABC transporter substrate-binding protein, partial [Lachnospira sp.]|nr:BMP family ABC transporter substrate-binding protein [Lachnospira sp.]
MANINAFAMGVKFTNPYAKVYLEWSSVKDRDVHKVFKEEGINYISDQDMITPQCSLRRFGLYHVEDETNRQNIAMPTWNWGVFYEKLIQSILSGSWKHDEHQEQTKALNYWWGMSANVIELIYSNKLPASVIRLVESFEKMICNDEFEPFAGVLVDQQGNIRNDDEHELTPEEIITMDWLLDNVVGSIPDVSELEDSAQLIVKEQGIM